jgi:hypothetical protein
LGVAKACWWIGVEQLFVDAGDSEAGVSPLNHTDGRRGKDRSVANSVSFLIRHAAMEAFSRSVQRVSVAVQRLSSQRSEVELVHSDGKTSPAVSRTGLPWVVVGWDQASCAA